jgi:hypothetical protein
VHRRVWIWVTIAVNAATNAPFTCVAAAPACPLAPGAAALRWACSGAGCSSGGGARPAATAPTRDDRSHEHLERLEVEVGRTPEEGGQRAPTDRHRLDFARASGSVARSARGSQGVTDSRSGLHGTHPQQAGAAGELPHRSRRRAGWSGPAANGRLARVPVVDGRPRIHASQEGNAVALPAGSVWPATSALPGSSSISSSASGRTGAGTATRASTCAARPSTRRYRHCGACASTRKPAATRDVARPSRPQPRCYWRVTSCSPPERTDRSTHR